MKLKIFSLLLFYLLLITNFGIIAQEIKEKSIPSSLATITSILDLGKDNAGQWTQLPSGKYKWNAIAAVPDVVVFEQELQRIIVPENCRLRIYNENKQLIYSSKSSDKTENVFSEMKNSCKVKLEYTELPVKGAMNSERQVKGIKPLEENLKIKKSSNPK